MRDQLRAAGIVAVGLLILLLGTPGLDFLDGSLQRPEKRQKILANAGPFWGSVGLGIYDVSRKVRNPLLDLFGPLQRPFRVSQNWSLYRDGPGKLMRLEIRVDDRIIYRSVDNEYRWREEVFRNRRLRPVVESTVMSSDSQNWRGLTRWVVDAARADFPETQRIDLIALHGPFPGDNLREHHRIVVEGPKWIARVVEANPNAKEESHEEGG
ncbi:MAG TPA: hypothetical protein PKW90_11935 [Myxococcota bacterium]|nr:hypothetical protein [Myxococcota bacterium]